ncbi:hypothetical protein EZV62_027405 [Acer yangbiense]|uniref:NAD(P)-binding domain-containing protein n=1 Tax=Acer yangbiense TaxID=1000413 RepID=A0A5C7GTL5_9ROSI|nr:hypothetical protein EZV62_027405 [Acer yangbiense]
MDTEEMAKSCQVLSLYDEDVVTCQISGEDMQEGFNDVTHCLVGKVLTGRRVNREAFIGVIEQLWSKIGQDEIESVGDNIFVFHFSQLEDRSMIEENVSVNKKIFVAGATGSTGKRIVEQLLAKGFAVKAGVRDLDKARTALLNDNPHLHIDSEKIAQVIGDDSEAVICATGFRPGWDLFAPWKDAADMFLLYGSHLLGTMRPP